MAKRATTLKAREAAKQEEAFDREEMAPDPAKLAITTSCRPRQGDSMKVRELFETINAFGEKALDWDIVVSTAGPHGGESGDIIDLTLEDDHDTE